MEKATPRKKTALKNRGIICSPNKRNENLCREKVIAHFRQQMQMLNDLHCIYKDLAELHAHNPRHSNIANIEESKSSTTATQIARTLLKTYSIPNYQNK